jgi:hypothetical protein
MSEVPVYECHFEPRFIPDISGSRRAGKESLVRENLTFFPGSVLERSEAAISTPIVNRKF